MKEFKIKLNYYKTSREIFYNNKMTNPSDMHKITYKLNKRAPKCMKEKQTELNEKTASSTIKTGALNTPLLTMARMTVKKIHKETQDMNNTKNQGDLTNTLLRITNQNPPMVHSKAIRCTIKQALIKKLKFK